MTNRFTTCLLLSAPGPACAEIVEYAAKSIHHDFTASLDRASKDGDFAISIECLEIAHTGLGKKGLTYVWSAPYLQKEFR